MFIGFDRKKEITVKSTYTPDRQLKVGAYPVLLHIDFPLKLAVYKDPCQQDLWTCCEWKTGIHISYAQRTRKETVQNAINCVQAFIRGKGGDDNAVLALINTNEVIN